jgi:hypothetical protein
VDAVQHRYAFAPVGQDFQEGFSDDRLLGFAAQPTKSGIREAHDMRGICAAPSKAAMGDGACSR